MFGCKGLKGLKYISFQGIICLSGRSNHWLRYFSTKIGQYCTCSVKNFITDVCISGGLEPIGVFRQDDSSDLTHG